MKKRNITYIQKNKLAYRWNHCCINGAQFLECACSKFFTSNSLLVKIKEDHYNTLRALNILQPALLIFQLNQDNQRTILTSLDVVFLFLKFSGHIQMIRLDFEVVRAVVTLLPTSSFASLAGRKFDSVLSHRSRMVTKGQLSRGFGGVRDKFDSIIPPPRIENC
jgi:hypothetical protein